MVCKRLNERPVVLNQNAYRSFRSDPNKSAFSDIFIDNIGPINVRFGNETRKVWLLIVTCLCTRAVSLQVSFSATTDEFLRCLQLHIYEYGMFKSCRSDMGSNITSGTKVIPSFLSDKDSKNFFQENNIECPQFETYPKGNSSLGSLVENCVKQVKHLLIKSIGKVVLQYPEFTVIIRKVAHIVNRRPLTFKESLRTNPGEELPTVITPEMLIYGRELPSVNIISTMALTEDENPAYSLEEIRYEYVKLQKCNTRLVKVYYEEFLTSLITQATDKRVRYKPVYHKRLAVGDIVLLVEPFTEQQNYPMGIIREVTVNELGEVTSALVFKGKTRELVTRHSTSLILLLQCDAPVNGGIVSNNRSIPRSHEKSKRPQRSAARVAKRNIEQLYARDSA